MKKDFEELGKCSNEGSRKTGGSEFSGFSEFSEEFEVKLQSDPGEGLSEKKNLRRTMRKPFN